LLHEICCPHQYTEKETKATIQIYNRNTTDEDKEAILQEFANSESLLRALFTTEALALGVDLPTIVRVIQFWMVRDRDAIAAMGSCESPWIAWLCRAIVG
jgi:superfamily II DNA/RNA helicase